MLLGDDIEQGAIVQHNHPPPKESVLGRQSKRLSISFDFSQIYGGQDNFTNDHNDATRRPNSHRWSLSRGGNNGNGTGTGADPNENQCCHIQ